jgi:ABC-type transporter Mla maintaining outer membrane lipid asymmetry permease subunit MlaE
MHLVAYLDANSGSLIIQTVLAGAAGAAVAVKLGWRRIAGKLPRKETQTEDVQQQDGA